MGLNGEVHILQGNIYRLQAKIKGLNGEYIYYRVTYIDYKLR